MSGQFSNARGIAYRWTAADVTAGSKIFSTPVVGNIMGAIVGTTQSDGTQINWDGQQVISGNKITIDDNGATNLSEDDIVTIVVMQGVLPEEVGGGS